MDEIKGFCTAEKVPGLSALDVQLISKTMKAHMAAAKVEMLPKRKPAGERFSVNQWPFEMREVFCAILADLEAGVDRKEIFETQGAMPAEKWGYGTPYCTGNFAPFEKQYGFEFPPCPVDEP